MAARACGGPAAPPQSSWTAGGVKSAVCAAGAALAAEYGFTFVGAHPMAGTERSGFSASRADLFRGASILLVPGAAGEEQVQALSDFLCKLGFGRVICTDAETHDAVIAYTSQLGPRRVQRLYPEPGGGYGVGLYRRQFSGYDAGGLSERADVDAALCR